MVAWQFCAIVGIIFIILEIFVPSMFFLNFALSAFLTASVSFVVKNLYFLIFIFFVFSFVSFIFLRPLLIKKSDKSELTGVDNKYLGKIVKAETEITSTSGVISIYGERWEARSEGDDIIPQGADVRIVRNESIIMYVSKD